VPSLPLTVLHTGCAALLVAALAAAAARARGPVAPVLATR
jgi:hypothetical protein